MNDQTAKADNGKLRPTLVDMNMVEAVAVTRQYGNEKYGDPDNWKTVSVERYRDALFRHLIAYLQEPYGRDAESNLPHIYHAATNMDFIIALEIAAGTIPDAQTALSQMRRPEAPRTDGTKKNAETTTNWCDSCKFAGRPLYEYPCSTCGIHFNHWEAKDGG